MKRKRKDKENGGRFLPKTKKKEKEKRQQKRIKKTKELHFHESKILRNNSNEEKN